MTVLYGGQFYRPSSRAKRGDPEKETGLLHSVRNDGLEKVSQVWLHLTRLSVSGRMNNDDNLYYPRMGYEKGHNNLLEWNFRCGENNAFEKIARTGERTVLLGRIGYVLWRHGAKKILGWTRGGDITA